MLNGHVFRRQMWAPAIGGIGGGVLPTPVAQTGNGGPKGLDGGSGARQMLADAGFPRAAGAPTALPTPKACDGERGRDKARARPDTKSRELATVVRDQMLPTPSASLHNYDEAPKSFMARRERLKTKGINGNGAGMPLGIAVKLLPTPTANDSKNASLPPSQADRDGLAGAMLRDDSIPIGEATYLNPSFVEEMMGFPVGWTA